MVGLNARISNNAGGGCLVDARCSFTLTLVWTNISGLTPTFFFVSSAVLFHTSIGLADPKVDIGEAASSIRVLLPAILPVSTRLHVAACT